MNTTDTTQAAELTTDTTTEAAELTNESEAAEKAASMGALMVLAEQEPQPAGAVVMAQPQAIEQEPPRAPLRVELADAITASVTLLEPFFPTLPTVYSPPTVQRLAVATEAVCVKRGWLANGLFGGASEEVMLAAVVIPVGLATWGAVRADLIRAKIEEKPWLSWLARVTGWSKRKAQAKAIPAEKPGAAAVSMGTAPAMEAAA